MNLNPLMGVPLYGLNCAGLLKPRASSTWMIYYSAVCGSGFYSQREVNI
jgi:hypothetical protein